MTVFQKSRFDYYRIVQRIPVIVFLLILGAILYMQGTLEFVHILKSVPIYIVLSYCSVVFSFLLINNRQFKKSLRVADFFKSMIARKAHFIHQTKVAILEEVAWRILPISLILLYFMINGWAIYAFLILINFLFAATHFFGKEVVQLELFIELFLSFMIFSVLYINLQDALILVVYHVMRNHMIFSMQKFK